MSELTWDQALGALMRAFAINIDESADYKPTDLRRLIRGAGLSVRRVAIIDHILPTAEMQAGCLLELEDDHWLAILGNGAEAVILSADGTAQRIRDATDIHNAVQAWVFYEKTTSLARIAPFLNHHKGKFAEIFICGLIVNLFALALPLFSSFVYDKILGNGITETLWALVIGLCILASVEFCVRVIRVMVAERFAVSSETDIDHTIFRNLLDAKANALPSIGVLLEKYKQIIGCRDFLSSSYLLSLVDLPFLILFLVIIATVSGPLVFVSIIGGGLMLLSSLLFALPVFGYDYIARRASEKRMGLMTDLLTAREAVIGSHLRDELSHRWRQSSIAATMASSLARYWRNMGMTITGTISYMSYVAVLVGGVYMVEAHTLTSGGLLAASMLTSRTMASFASVTTLIIRYREFRTALHELNQIFPAASVGKTPKKSHGLLKGAVRFDRITCRLREDSSPVLDNISINIAPGEMVGIAGAPGAGKTTLLRLLVGVLQPDEGQVLIDNIPVGKLSPEDISLNIGFKPQEFCLLDGTIEENVCAARPTMTAQERQDVLIASGLARAFHDGLNWSTEIGARGSNLSGGQRQLVSLARAMLNNPPLLILDEPTNGLDAALEAHLAEQLIKRKGRSTILVSTHSRNLLAACDRIIVVGQSRILADGPRDKVLA